MTSPVFSVGLRVVFNHCGRKVCRTVQEATPCGRKGRVKINGYLLWLNSRRVLAWWDSAPQKLETTL